MTRKLIGPMLGTVLAVAAVTAGAQETLWTPAQIKAEWAGKKLFSRAASGGFVDVWFKEDGTLELATNNFSDRGTWRLSEKGYCTTYEKIRNGEERCFTVATRSGQVQVINPDGSLSGTVLRTQ